MKFAIRNRITGFFFIALCRCKTAGAGTVRISQLRRNEEETGVCQRESADEDERPYLSRLGHCPHQGQNHQDQDAVLQGAEETKPTWRWE